MTDEVEEDAIRSELQDLVLETAQIEGFLDGMVKIAARELGDITGRKIYSAVTLLRPKRSGTVASSSGEARNMDEVQYAFDDGPCLRAAREHYTVIVQDFHTEDRFGEYTKAVAGHGIRSALGVPILLEGEANAGLDLYCREPLVFNAESVEAAEQFARRASHSLQIAVRVANLMEHSRDMSAAMESRTTIDLAVGIVMGQNRCTQEEAINILKAASSARNVKLNAVAAAVVESVNQQGASTHFDA